MLSFDNLMSFTLGQEAEDDCSTEIASNQSETGHSDAFTSENKMDSRSDFSDYL